MKKIILITLGLFILLASPLSVHATCPGWASSKLIDNGADTDRFNIVIMGDGFDSSSQSSFDSVASALTTDLFNIDFYVDYEAAFNVYQVNVISTDNCVDNPNNATPLCDTALDTSYNTGGVQRCVLPGDFAAVRDAADCATTNWDVVVVIANDSEWGGCASGNISAVANYTGSIDEVTAHEFGHAIGDLADEYDYDDLSSYTGAEPSRVNCTINATATIKWSSYLTTATLPTDETAAFDTDIGAFQGCSTYDTSIYRPSQHCKMISSSEDFCDICYNEMADAITPYIPVDDDADGYTTADGDCDDSDSSVYPGATETCSDGIDQDCSGADLSCSDVDNDGDGYTDNAGDCNDANVSINPSAIDICDGVDNDCDSYIDADCDDDSDGLTNSEEWSYGSDPNDSDTDDDSLNDWSEINVYGTSPISDDTDEDGETDDREINIFGTDPTNSDTDGDDFSDLEELEKSWDPLDSLDPKKRLLPIIAFLLTSTDLDDDGYNSIGDGGEDCDDEDSGVNPDVTEICGDGIDQDCDGTDYNGSDEACVETCVIEVLEVLGWDDMRRYRKLRKRLPPKMVELYYAVQKELVPMVLGDSNLRDLMADLLKEGGNYLKKPDEVINDRVIEEISDLLRRLEQNGLPHAQEALPYLEELKGKSINEFLNCPYQSCKSLITL